METRGVVTKVRTRASRTNIENTLRVRIPVESPMLRMINSTGLKEIVRIKYLRGNETTGPLQHINNPTVLDARQLIPESRVVTVQTPIFPAKSRHIIAMVNPQVIPARSVGR
jgi:hypothetical protein